VAEMIFDLEVVSAPVEMQIQR